MTLERFNASCGLISTSAMLKCRKTEAHARRGNHRSS